jgi:hypothetical protein
MGIQVRAMHGADPRFYAPNRDCAYYGPRMLRRVMDSLTEESLEPFIVEMLKKHELTLQHVGEAAMVVAKIMNRTGEPGAITVADAMRDAGVEDAHPVALAVIWMRLGVRQFGAIWRGVRSATGKNEAPPKDVDEVVRAGERASYYLRMPRWKRWLSRQWAGFKHWVVRKLSGQAKPPETGSASG